ncbi:MAG TPA: helix-turn-helix domain-containing protein [Telmatospirillum sp.]|nr:helix-turn-helix domain-containing protein [Telmatospirillum sp.]
MNGRLNTQAGFQGVIQFANGDASHDAISIIIDVNIIIAYVTCQPGTALCQYVAAYSRRGPDENAYCKGFHQRQKILVAGYKCLRATGERQFQERSVVRIAAIGPSAKHEIDQMRDIGRAIGQRLQGGLVVASGRPAAVAWVIDGGDDEAVAAGDGGDHPAALLGSAAVVAGSNAPGPVASQPTPAPAPRSIPPGPEPEDSQVIAELDGAMRSKALYRDPELSLDRLARKMMVPTRRISLAVNRVKGINVSQYVNEFRIGDACRRLGETDESIMQIMFEVGFLTKSNFNREFLRVTGKSPSAWRTEQKTAPTATPIRPRRDDALEQAVGQGEGGLRR